MKMNKKTSLLGGISLGATIMYFLDPDRGKQRRGLARDQVAHLARLIFAGLVKSARDLRQRLSGLLAELRWLPTREAVPNDVLVARVRAKIGHVNSHPGALEVTASNGTVRASGPILASEVEQTLVAIRSVRGIKDIDNHLEVYEQPDDIPGLQMGGTLPRTLQHQERRWPPSTRLFAIITGGLFTFFGIRRQNIPGSIAGAVGAGLLARGITNMGLRRLIGIDASRPAITLQKTISIHAPVEQIFALWSHYEALPQVMAHLREVRRTHDDESTWIVTGPLGLPVRWRAVITALKPYEVIGWQTLPGSTVSQVGMLRFESMNTGTTRLGLRLSYTPPGGALGHLLATLLGANPKRMIDQDLVRFKSLVEYGRTSAHGEGVTREQLLRELAQSGQEPALPAR